MFKKTFLLIVLISIVTIGCKTGAKKKQVKVKTDVTIPIREHSIQALLWQQQSAEYKALCHQAFNLATLHLNEALQKTYKRPIAIVTDIDETVLDNSPYNARMVKNDENYTSLTWSKWVKEEKAKPVPGALEFFKYAADNNVTIFYVSNRKDILKKETIANLIKEGFPNVDEEHVLLKTETSGKEPRRALINNTHQIFMLLGDNLSDFSDIFDHQNTAKRNRLVTNLSNDFGVKYIVLPNPMYGDWETKGIYESSYKWTETQKDSIRKVKLRLK
ncbi:MAG: 5'-nucleotidase, lipoprotein e(P4) family [Flavobacteriaceae bacterium]